MTKDDLLFGFGEIDDQILDSMLRRQINQEIRNRRRKKARKGVVMTSAGMILAAAAIVLIMIFSGTKESDISRLPSGTEIFTEADSLSKEVTETAAEMESPETGYTDIEAEKQAEEDTGAAEEAGRKAEAYTEEETKADTKADTPEYAFYTVRAENGGIKILDPAGSSILELERALVILDASTPVNQVEAWNNSKDGQGSGHAQKVLEGEISWNREEPLPIVIPAEGETGNTNHGSCGIWSIEAGGWLVSPEDHGYLNLIGNGLWTDSEQMVCGGSLMRMDGTVLATENTPAAFREYAGYIIGAARSLFDMDGNRLCQLPPEEIGGSYLTVNDMLDDAYVVTINAMDGSGRSTVFYDFDNNELFRESSGLGYNGHCENYLNWIDTDGQCLVTDRNLNIVLTQPDFYAKNPQYVPSGQEAVRMQVCEVREDGYTILLSSSFGGTVYVYCDFEGKEM